MTIEESNEERFRRKICECELQARYFPDNCPNQELFFELNVKQEHVTNDVYDNDENIEKKSAGVQKLTHRQPSRLRREKCERTDNCQTENTWTKQKQTKTRPQQCEERIPEQTWTQCSQMSRLSNRTHQQYSEV